MLAYTKTEICFATSIIRIRTIFRGADAKARVKVCYELNKTPAQAFTPPADEKKKNGHNMDICVLRRLRLREGQMQGFLGLKVGEGVLICKYGI